MQIYHTLSNGIQGTSMPSFDLLPGEERMAMAHYVRTFVPNAPDDPPDLVLALPVIDETEGSAATTSDSTSVDSSKTAKKTIPLDQAREQILMQQAKAPKVGSQIIQNELFLKYCSSCHGSRGEGKLIAEQVVPSSVIYLETGNLIGRQSKILADKNALEQFLTGGTYALKENHRFGFLTKKELEELFKYVKYLSGISQ